MDVVAGLGGAQVLIVCAASYTVTGTLSISFGARTDAPDLGAMP